MTYNINDCRRSDRPQALQPPVGFDTMAKYDVSHVAVGA